MKEFQPRRSRVAMPPDPGPSMEGAATLDRASARARASVFISACGRVWGSNHPGDAFGAERQVPAMPATRLARRPSPWTV